MEKLQFLIQMDELLELSPNTLKGDEQLSNLANWDSLAVIGFIALVDENYDVTVSSAGIKAAKSIDDLMQLVAKQLS